MWTKLNHFKRSQNSMFGVLSAMKSKTLFQLPAMSFAISRRKKLDPDVLAEREEFYRQISLYRKRHKEEYERLQAEKDRLYYDPESDELPPEIQKLVERRRKNETKERTSIIKVAMHTKRQIMHREKKEIETLEKEKWHQINDMMKMRERQMYLQALQIDDNPPIPPPTIVDFTHYYERLQNIAMLTVHGKYEEVEKALKHQETIDEKNLHLQPLFRKLKKCIRYITKTDEAKLNKKYQQKIAGVLTGPVDDKKNLIANLREEFEDELMKIRKRDSQPKMQLKKLETHITTLFHLLMLWTQYTDIIYAPENLMQGLKFQRLNVAKTQEMSEKQHQEYLRKVLMTNENEEFVNYQTVEEGITTDTTDTEEEIVKMAEEQEKLEKEAEENPFGEDDGILGQLMAQEEEEENEDEILSFANKELDLDSHTKHEMELDYGIGEGDVRDFKQKIQSQGKIHQEESTPGSISNLDMFGEDDDINENLRQRDQDEIEMFVRQQLEDITANLGAAESGIDTYQPDSGYDPHQPIDEITNSKIQAKNTSIILDVYYDRLKAIPDEDLTKNEIKTKKKLMRLSDYVSRIRMIDAPVFAEIYELYRY